MHASIGRALQPNRGEVNRNVVKLDNKMRELDVYLIKGKIETYHGKGHKAQCTVMG